MPASPWMTSSMMAQVSSSIIASSISILFASVYLNPSGSGAKPFWYFVWPVALSAPIVRPWKDWIIEMIVWRPVLLPYLRASLIADSFASAPLLQKNALPRPLAWQSFSASSICGTFQ